MKSIFLLVIALIGQIYNLTFRIQSRDPYCFRVPVESGDKLQVMFNVNGNKVDQVQFRLLNSGGSIQRTIKPNIQSPTQNFVHDIKEGGKYHLCFQRLDSEMKVIFLNWEILSFKSSGTKMDDNADHASIQNLETRFKQLHVSIDRVNNFIQVQENDEEEQHVVTNQTNKKVLIWSLIKIAIIIAICVFQIYFVTSYFATKDTIGKKLVRLGMKHGGDDFQKPMV